MIGRFNISQIFADGVKLLRGNIKIIGSSFIFLILPALMGSFLLSFKVAIDSDAVSNIISSISIFSGLLFSVIFILAENYTTRKSSVDHENAQEEDVRYVERYRFFANNTSTLILFSVVLAVMIILMLLSYLFIEKVNYANASNIYKIVLESRQNVVSVMHTSKTYLLLSIQVVSFVLLFNYMLTILAIVKEVYAMVYEDINRDK